MPTDAARIMSGVLIRHEPDVGSSCLRICRAQAVWGGLVYSNTVDSIDESPGFKRFVIRVRFTLDDCRNPKQGLAPPNRIGPTRRLNPQQETSNLKRMCEDREPKRSAGTNQLWTTQRIADLIFRQVRHPTCTRSCGPSSCDSGLKWSHKNSVAAREERKVRFDRETRADFPTP